MVLDITFIILSSLIILSLIPLYIYRKQIFKSAYKKGQIDLFIKDLKLHMKTHHPRITISYSIIEKTIHEKDIRIRETLIVENVLNQFFNYKYEKETQIDIKRENHWPTYEDNSKSNSKVPIDWQKRKEFSWKRDNGKCNRCGQEINIKDTITVFVKDIQNGGGYNFENLINLCSDCNKITHSKNANSTISNLLLNDKLMFFVES